MIVAQSLGYEHFLAHLNLLDKQEFSEFKFAQKTFDVEDSLNRFELDQKHNFHELHS